MAVAEEQIVKPYHRTDRFGLYEGDCRSVLPMFADCCFDSIVCDPPYELGFMGKGWDRSGIAYDVDVWRECLRVLKPGAHLLAFGGSRTYHRLACAIEDAGFEIRDQIQWLYGCLSDDTEILINGQWEPYHKAVKGSRALCYNMDHDTYEWQPIQELFVYQYSDTAYRIQSDSTDQIVSRNHRCIIERGGAYTFGIAEEVARERQARVPVLENVSAVLNALPLLDQRASNSEQDVFSVMHGEANLNRKDGENKTTFGTERPSDYLRRLSEEEMEVGHLTPQSDSADVLIQLQRKTPGSNSHETQVRQDRNEVSGNGIKGRQEPGVEGRSYLLSETWELQADKVRAMPAGILSNGPQGWICDGAQIVSGPSNRAQSASPGSGPSRRSRSGQQSVEQLPSIRFESRSQTIRASRFTRSDLARITPFHYDGVVWCVRVPSGAFVARRNGKVFITGNSGFPKSLDVSKAIDAAAGAEREVVGFKIEPDGRCMALESELPRICNPNDKEDRKFGSDNRTLVERKLVTAPATDEAKQWDGWGTALKPAHEPIVLARKPLIGTVAENVLQHGTGGLNIDGCRVGNGGQAKWERPRGAGYCGGYIDHGDCAELQNDQGRWPANVIHDGSEEVLVEFPETESGNGNRRPNGGGEFFKGIDPFSANFNGDSGSAARFFYCAKATQQDRNEGLEDLPHRVADETHKRPRTELDDPRRHGVTPRQNYHPTVKPTDLMRYLCRLITPPGGIVLDPFCGSGSTGKAAMLEGFKFVGIELDADYCQLARLRIEAVTRQGLLFA